MKKITTMLSAAALSTLLLTSCSKSDNPVVPGVTTKTVKLTFTVTGNLTNGDYISFVASGGTGNNDKTIWKVNGVTQNNEEVVGFDANDFDGSTKTYVVESVSPLLACSVGIQCLNFDAPYTISYKAEVNGKVVNNDQNISVTENDDYTHDYSY